MSMLHNPTQMLTRVEGVDTDGAEFVRWRQPFASDEPSLAQQQFKDEADINNIIARYRVSGLAPQRREEPMYGDFTQMPDYQEALNIIVRGDAIFGSLSSDVRSKFENDPVKFLEFARDPANVDQLREWNLVPPADPVPKTLDDVYEVLSTKSTEPPKEA